MDGKDEENATRLDLISVKAKLLSIEIRKGNMISRADLQEIFSELKNFEYLLGN